MRTTLRRHASCQILTETEPGLFAFTPTPSACPARRDGLSRQSIGE
jgi:hypothetical protein